MSLTETKRIVIATDGSADALAAVKEGVSLAQRLDAPVTFVCVRTPPASIFAEPLHPGAIDQEMTRARRAVDEAMRVAIDAEVDADYEIVDGSPVEAVLDVARNMDAWLIVVGSRGRGAVQGALFGLTRREQRVNHERSVLLAEVQARAAAAADSACQADLARAPSERLSGRPAIVLDVGRRDPIRISTPEPGALHELLDALTVAGKQ